MDTYKSFESELYKVNNSTFNEFALELFRYQAVNNPLYKQYLQVLGHDYHDVTSIYQIPFLPITFFKSHTVKTGRWQEEKIFTSSGTTGNQSQHLVQSLEFYLRNAERSFNHFFGDLSQYHFLALLPSYLEREGSSLIDMVEYFIKKTNSPYSGFYLHNHDDLIAKLEALRSSDRKVILLGVTFALLNLAEKAELDLSHCLVMETGGMKGRRKELTRAEVHEVLTSRFNVGEVYSEYGMTEMLSQAYSMGSGLFQTPPWVKVVFRDPEDPFEHAETRKNGAVNVIDLANLHTCAFIETQDQGKMDENGYFEVIGRIDNSDIRGCNLLVG